MSDKEDDSKPDLNEKRKPGLKSATNKLKAEALRRLKLEDAEYDETKTNEDQDVDTTGELAANENISGQPDPTNIEDASLPEKDDNLNQDEKILETSNDLKSSPNTGLSSENNIHGDAVEVTTSDVARPDQSQNEAESEPVSKATEPSSEKQKESKEEGDTGETGGTSTTDERLEKEEDRKDRSGSTDNDDTIKDDTTTGDSRGSNGAVEQAKRGFSQPSTEAREVSDNKMPSSSAEHAISKSNLQGSEEVEDPKNGVIEQSEAEKDSGDTIIGEGRDSSGAEAIASVEQAEEALSEPSSTAKEATDPDKKMPSSSSEQVTTNGNSQKSEEAQVPKSEIIIKDGETGKENEQEGKGEETKQYVKDEEIGSDKRDDNGKDEKEEKYEPDGKGHDIKETKETVPIKEIVDSDENKNAMENGKVHTKTSNADIPDIVSTQSTETETKSDTNRRVNDEEKSDKVSPPLSELPEGQTENKPNNNSSDATNAGDNKDVESKNKSDNLVSTNENLVTKQDGKDGSNSENNVEPDKATNDNKTNDEMPQDVPTMNSEDKINKTEKSSQEDGKTAQSDRGAPKDKQATEEESQQDKVQTSKQEEVVNETVEKESDVPKETRKDDEIDEGKEGEKKIASEGQQKNEESQEIEGNNEKQVEGDLIQEGALETQVEGAVDEEEAVLPDDFFYDFEDFVSKPYSSEGIPNNLLTLHHSFGYECTKRENLHVMDEDTILFSAGNMGQLLNIKTKEQTYFRTTGGGGIGAIAIHPSRKYFAVAEKGIKPNINVFEYPSLKLYRVLRDGTEEAYSNLDFSPDGTKLASVGCAPDFMLTVWDWKNEKILLRYKAFSQDIYKVAFSPDNEGHVNTSGSGHIRFWTMANTFTGLKLQGMIGKFGAKEISDIEGFVELPDGKVLSGSDWGNMLLWEGGLIKVEICKKGKKPCHHGMIQQFFMDEGELMTIGVDGFVKVWDFESIDNADTDDEGALFEVDPMYELKVGTDVKLMSMQKAVNSEAPIWYAQDAGGGIWKLDLSFTHTSHAPERMFSYHAGCITGLDTSPVAHFVATSGEDHTVRVYDYLAKKQICHSKFNSGSSTLLWVPKIVNAKGTCILAGFQDGVVRLLTLNKVDLSQVRSKKSKSDFELNLTQVFKPHTKPVTVMTIDDKGELLATGSSDCTVFFFTIDDTYKPIGFVETASPVVSIEWSNKGKKERSVLVSCKDGTVLEVEAPDPGEHDTSKTFHLPLKNLKITEFFFKRVKDKLRKAEADAIKAKEKEAKRKKKEAERARRRERGLEEEDEEEQEEEEEDEEEVEEPQDHGPSQIIKGFYHNKSDKFFLSMDGWDAGYLYECEFLDKPTAVEDKGEEPVRSIPVVDSNDAPIRSVYMTHSKKFFLFGMEDGTIRIHPLEDGTDLEHLSSYWSFSIHDNHHGAITKIITSFDDKYVFTSGADGNFFVHKFMDKAVKGIKIKHKVSLPSPKRLIGEDGQEIKHKVDDIDDPNFYSIELEKQKAEHDKMVKLAEEKKQNVRRKITNLRKAFKQLMSRNHELPDHVQLKSEEFIIDPDMKNDLKAKTQEKIDLVHKELAWETEKHSIGLKKMQKRFKDEIECERIVLRAFNSEHLVSTFRASKPDYLETLQREEQESSKVGEGPEGGPRKSIAGGRQLRRQSTKDKMEPTQQSQQQPQQQTQGQSQLGGKVAKALEKAEARRKKRLNRQAQWDELYRNKPDENYEDPKDKAAIKEAKENMGDYKLKTAKDYVVPESQRVNADKKRLQLLKLLDQIHQYKFDFNQSFLSLRNKKIAIIKKAKDSTAKILEIQKKMDSYARRPIPKVPEMMPDEQPEKRLEYTRDRLLEFKKQLKDTTKSSGGQDEGGGFGGFGGFGGGGGGGPAESSKPGKAVARDRSISSVSFHSAGRPKSSLSGVTEKGTPEPSLEEVPEEPTPLEQLMLQEEQIKLQYEQDLLIDGIKSMMEKFDADLRTLRHDKGHLEIALKCADLRQVTLFEEFMLLKDFEKRENVYANKVNTKIHEKDEMQDKVEDCQMTLEAKKQEIDKLLEQEKALYSTFSTALGENNKFENFLTRVFKKKIKRAKKKPQAEEGSDEDSDEEDSDEDLSSSDEEDSDAEELDDSVCPPGCDQALFDQICQLREKKLDLEELLADEKKASETLKKEYDALVKKAKVIDSALNTAEADLEAFQREKQQKLNELDVVVILRLSQIQHMVNNAIPQDLSQSLIFNAPGLNHLQYRIKELEKEKHEQKRLYREHRQKHVQLIRDKKVMESRIAELEEKVQNMMMLKFGRLVDLEKLEKVTVSRTVEELKEKLRQQEIKSARDIAKWDVKIDSYKGKTTQLTRENTQRLDTFTILLQEKKELEQMLDSRQKSLGTEFTGARKADLRERQRLIQLVQLQAQEIDALKDEITLLSRKGGHILPPAQPPLPPGQTPIPNT